MAVHIFTELCKHHCYQFMNIFIMPKRNLVSPSHPPPAHPSPHHPLATANLLSVAMALPILDISHKWNHTVQGPFWLPSITPRYVSRFIHGPCTALHSSSLTSNFHCVTILRFVPFTSWTLGFSTFWLSWIMILWACVDSTAVGADVDRALTTLLHHHLLTHLLFASFPTRSLCK